MHANTAIPRLHTRRKRNKRKITRILAVTTIGQFCGLMNCTVTSSTDADITYNFIPKHVINLEDFPE